MNYYLKTLLFFLFVSLAAPWMNFAYAQESGNRIWNELQALNRRSVNFPLWEPLRELPLSQLASHFRVNLPCQYWEPDATVLLSLSDSRPEQLSLKLKDPDQIEWTIQLVRQDVAGRESRILYPGETEVDVFSGGVYYRGIVSGQPHSVAALSFFPDQVSGVISIPGRGNLVLGKAGGGSGQTEQDAPHVLYYDRDVSDKPEFQCGVPEELSESFRQEAYLAPDSLFDSRCKVIKIFLECDYRMYTDQGRNRNQVVNYITGLFNVVKTLYYNEYVDVEISDIMVWNTQDPFLHTDLQSILFHYTNYRRTNFNGNLAQLVTTYAPQQQGGIAWLGTLCQGFNGQSGPNSFAYIYNSYNQLPNYSWSVEVMAHELGHNFGLPHTHACFWGPGRNSTLDNCQPPENNACSAGPAPIGGGTIMSYCHLTGYGINFSKGFGQEPGDLMRSNVQNRSCLSAKFVPIMEASLSKPYVEGDPLSLKARPSKAAYDYQWFHYDYPMPSARDSVFTPAYSGIYRVAISDRCTEYSTPDTVRLSDFLVNLGCPVIPGAADSLVVSLTMNADQGSTRDSLMVPDSLYKKIPSWARDVLVKLRMDVVPQGSSWTRDVISAYYSPPEIDIANTRFVPNAAEPAQFRDPRSYTRILGRFDPAGTWAFTTNDNKFDNGVDARVTFSIVLSWRAKDSVASCDLPVCEGQSRVLDAGIRNASYKWTGGETTRTINTSKLGPVGVEVTRGNRKSSHQVNLYEYPLHYQQHLTRCDGDTLTIGKNKYSSTGMYVDTLKSVTGCDSILMTELQLLENPVERMQEFICYADSFRNQSYSRDTLLRFHYSAANGCDSTLEVQLKVNPAIAVQAVALPACPESGGTLEALASGGSGTAFEYRWSNGRSGAKLDSIASGNYEVQALDSAGCGASASIDLENLDSVGVLPLIFDLYCFGDTTGRIYLDFNSGVAPFSVTWSNGAVSKDIVNLPAGNYTAFIRDANGCQAVQNLEVKSPELLFLQVDVTGSTGNNGAAKAQVSGGTKPYTYLWSTGENQSEITGLAPGSYKVWIDDFNGCKAQSEFEVLQVTRVQEAGKPTFFFIFPNPATHQLWIRTAENHKASGWRAQNAQGRVTDSGILDMGGSLFQIELNGWVPGMYWFELEFEGGKRSGQILIKQ